MRCQLLDEMESKVDAMRAEKDKAQGEAHFERTEKEAAQAEVKRISDLYRDVANHRDALSVELDRTKSLYAAKVDAYMKLEQTAATLRAEHAEAMALLDRYKKEREQGA